MNQRIPFTRILQYIIVLGMFAAALWLYPSLPNTVPIHWNLAGHANGWAPKIWGVWLTPVIALLLTLLFPLFAVIDPKHKNYADFAHAWNVLQLAIIALLAYIEYVVFYIKFHPADASVAQMILIGVGIFFIISGNYMGKIRQNFFIGVRTPWTLSDPEVWQQSQRIGGWTFVASGIATILLGLFVPNPHIWLIMVIVAIAVIPVLSSYILYQRKRRD